MPPCFHCPNQIPSKLYPKSVLDDIVFSSVFAIPPPINPAAVQGLPLRVPRVGCCFEESGAARALRRSIGVPLGFSREQVASLSAQACLQSRARTASSALRRGLHKTRPTGERRPGLKRSTLQQRTGQWSPRPPSRPTPTASSPPAAPSPET